MDVRQPAGRKRKWDVSQDENMERELQKYPSADHGPHDGPKHHEHLRHLFLLPRTSCWLYIIYFLVTAVVYTRVESRIESKLHPH